MAIVIMLTLAVTHCTTICIRTVEIRMWCSTPLIENLEEGGFELSFYARTSSTSYPGGFRCRYDRYCRAGNYGVCSNSAKHELNRATLRTNSSRSIWIPTSFNMAIERVGFRFYSKTNSYDYVYIDDVEIECYPNLFELQSCRSQTLRVQEGKAAGLTWDLTVFNIEYGPSGFVQGTGIGSTVSNVSVPHTFSNLNQNTTYDYYVQNCCTNQWEGPFSFTTECSGPLSGGVYTVGSTGSFETIDSAFTVLNNCGISGPITLQLLSGYHVPSVELGSINGSSASNTVTIKGSASASDTLRNIVFNGTSYLTLSDLSIKSNGGYAIRLNGTSHIEHHGEHYNFSPIV